jgi:hypothetical protein
MEVTNEVWAHFIQEFTKLSLWYVDKRVRAGESGFEDALNHRTNLHQYTSLYGRMDHPGLGVEHLEWMAIVAGLRKIHLGCGNQPSSDRFESEGIAFLAPHMVERIEAGGDLEPASGGKVESMHVPIGGRWPADTGWPYECWRYDTREDYINIHVLNVYRPSSPLKERLVPFVASLMRLLTDAKSAHPEITDVRCGSWLNSLPAFYVLFPSSWKQREVVRAEMTWSNGIWGQFMDRRGDFHEKNGELFRETGEVPYVNTLCWAPIEEVLAHLAINHPIAVEYSGLN